MRSGENVKGTKHPHFTLNWRVHSGGWQKVYTFCELLRRSSALNSAEEQGGGEERRDRRERGGEDEEELSFLCSLTRRGQAVPS